MAKVDSAVDCSSLTAKLFEGSAPSLESFRGADATMPSSHASLVYTNGNGAAAKAQGQVRQPSENDHAADDGDGLPPVTIKVERPLPRMRAMAVLAWPTILRKAIRSYGLAFGVKAGIALLLKLISRVRAGPGKRGHLAKARTKQLSLLELFWQTTMGSADAHRIGALFGLFTFLFHGTVRVQEQVPALRKRPPRAKAFVAGAVAGLSLAVETPENRLMFAQQFSMRAMQAGYNGLKHRDLFHFPLGDSLLFVVSCASIMYSYIQYPGTLQPEMYTFMVRTAQIPKHTLAAARAITKGQMPDLAGLILRAGKSVTPANKAAMEALAASARDTPLSVLPCCFVHPSSDSCTAYCGKLSRTVFMAIFPVYFVLHFVPGFLLRFGSVSKEPAKFMSKALQNTVRSGLFLATYVTGYQAQICVQRALLAAGWLKRDHRFYYYLFGLTTALSILIEDKRRRSELGMYVAPKAIHAVYQIMTDHKKWLPRTPHVDVGVFAAAMGTIMSFYVREPERLSAMVLRVLPRFIRKVPPSVGLGRSRSVQPRKPRGCS